METVGDPVIESLSDRDGEGEPVTVGVTVEDADSDREDGNDSVGVTVGEHDADGVEDGSVTVTGASCVPGTTAEEPTSPRKFMPKHCASPLSSSTHVWYRPPLMAEIGRLTFITRVGNNTELAVCRLPHSP